MRQFVLLILFASFSLSTISMASLGHGCWCSSKSESISTRAHCSHSHVESQNEDSTSTRHAKSHDSRFRSDCCNPIILGSIQRPLPVIEIASINYLDEYVIFKPDPSLEAPFQPPRS